MSARFRAEDRSAPHTNAESSPFFVTAYFRIPGLDDKWDRAFGEDTDGGFIRQDWDDEAERRALDFWLSGASSKAADYERDSFSLVDVRLFHHDDILSVTYLFKARQLVSGEDAAHQFAAFSRECNAKAFSLKRHEGHYEAIAGHEATDGDDGQYFNALRLALAHRLECLCATLCVELAQVEVARTENNTFNFTPFDEDALVLTDGIFFTDKVFLPVCFMNIRKGSSAPAFSEELDVGEPGDTKCLFQEDYSIGASGDGENGGRQRHELAVKRRVPTKGFANVFKYRIAKSDPMTNTVFDTDKDAPTNINIPGIQNFRDLGGYPSYPHHKFVRWGMLYRSGEINRLRKGSLKKLKNLGIRTIIDLRSPEEKMELSKSLEKNFSVVSIPIATGNMEQIINGVQDRSIRSDTVYRIVERMNRELITKYAAQYRKVFDLLLNEDNYPVVIHCSSGKGRTGIVSALILACLDVNEDKIMEDYRLSNDYFNIPRATRYAYNLPVRSQEAITTLFSAREDFLNAAKEEAERQYGDIKTYLREGIGLSKQEMKHLRNILLTKQP